MKIHKLFILLCLFALTATTVSAQTMMTLEQLRNLGKTKTELVKIKKEKPKVMEDKSASNESDKGTEAPSLIDNSNAEVPTPFIYVVRTKSDWENIKPLVGELYLKKEIDFSKQAIVAAFAGMKNTGGYSVSVKKAKDGVINIGIKSPESGDMTTQAITYPHKVALVDVQEEDSLNIIASEEFMSEMTTYKVTSGNFEFEGGFIGRETKFDATGEVRVMKFNDLVTFSFNLKGVDNESGRILNELASGSLKENSATINRLEAGNFIDRPHPPLDVSVSFTENKLTMKFEPGKRNYIVNDGFVGRGSLEAVLQN